MNFYTIDIDKEVMQVTESRTVKVGTICLGTAIAVWLRSGQDSPDADFTDGISEQEGAML
jgi:hypothetical protein